MTVWNILSTQMDGEEVDFAAGGVWEVFMDILIVYLTVEFNLTLTYNVLSFLWRSKLQTFFTVHTLWWGSYNSLQTLFVVLCRFIHLYKKEGRNWKVIKRWEKACSEYFSCDSTPIRQHITWQNPHSGLQYKWDWRLCQNQKGPRYVVLCLSGSLNISGNGTVSDILSCPPDNIHLYVFLPLNKRFFGKVMLIIHPRQRNTELQWWMALLEQVGSLF